jgi:hypothetical protein
MVRHQLIVLTNPKDGRENEFNEWYDRRHIPDVLDVPGFVAARRLRLSAAPGMGGAPAWAYMAVYDIESDDPRAAVKLLLARIGTDAMPMSAALDEASLKGFIATPLP